MYGQCDRVWTLFGVTLNGKGGTRELTGNTSKIDMNGPRPQKGQCIARHRTKTSPIWIQGGKAHGNKGPRSYFHMKPYHYRVAGLIHTLSAKLAQDDVRFVKDLEIPSDDPKFIEDLIDERG